MRRRFTALLLAACALLLAGCGNLFSREYYVVTDYELPPKEDISDAGGVSVQNITELRHVLTGLIDEGAEEGRIVFDAAYAGDISADIAAVCWQVRTQDALFAYCVESISYDVSNILSHAEAQFTIRYTEAGQDRDSIVRLQLTTGLEAQLRKAIASGQSRLVVLINRSRFTAEDVESLASRVYRENPVAQPQEPRVTVNMLSGTGSRRLYEINFSYSLSPEELETRREELQALEPFSDPLLLSSDPPYRALAACEVLLARCQYTESGRNDIYAALIEGEANSEGLALAYVELCRQMEIPCQIVYGQRDWRNRCWNIIQLDGAYYHVDVALCISEGLEQGFLLQDQTMWSSYRWDVSSYPPCSGSLRYSDLVPDAPL